MKETTKSVDGVLHGEYWVDGKCTKTFDIPTVVIDEGINTILDVTFHANPDQIL